jgi:hypothetical protein
MELNELPVLGDPAKEESNFIGWVVRASRQRIGCFTVLDSSQVALLFGLEKGLVSTSVEIPGQIFKKNFRTLMQSAHEELFPC